MFEIDYEKLIFIPSNEAKIVFRSFYTFSINFSSGEDMVLLAAVADSAERAVENNITTFDSSPKSAVNGNRRTD